VPTVSPAHILRKNTHKVTLLAIKYIGGKYMLEKARPVILASGLSATMGLSGWFIEREIDRVVYEMREIQKIHRNFEIKLQDHEYRIDSLEKKQGIK